MPRSQTPVLAAIGAVALGVSLAATGGSTQAVSSAPVLMAASYAAEPADPAPIDPAPVAGDLVTGVVGNTASGNVIEDTLQAVDVGAPLQVVTELLKSGPLAVDDLDPTKLPEQLLGLNPAPETVDQILSAVLP
jgi:hypothetical protein